MIERLFSIVVGALVTFLLLLLFHNGRLISNEISGFATAVAIGAVINLLWPFIWGQVSARRAQQRRTESIQDEVQRQVTAQRPPTEVE